MSPVEKNKLIESLMPLATYYAGIFRRTWIDIEDLCQVSFEILIKAVDDYLEEERNYSLRTHIDKRLRWDLIDYFRKNNPDAYRSCETWKGKPHYINIDRYFDDSDDMLPLIDEHNGPEEIRRFEAAVTLDKLFEKVLDCPIKTQSDRNNARHLQCVKEYFLDERTMLDIADQEGVTESRVSQIVKSGLEILKHNVQMENNRSQDITTNAN